MNESVAGDSPADNTASSKMRREREASLSCRWLLIVSLAVCAVASSTELVAPATDATSKSSSSSEEDSSSSSKEANVSDDLIFLTSESGPTKMPAKYDDLLKQLELEEEQEESFNPAAAVNMSDFLSLIPAWQVQTIINNYYRHDEEVQRAYDFIKNEIFELLQLSDVLALTNYLHGIGLDVVDLMQTVVMALKSATPDSQSGSVEPEAPIVSAELKGVHGLVDSVLSLLSMEKFSRTYAERVKTDEQFARFSSNLFSPELKIILINLYYSEPVRELFYKDKDDIYLPQIYEFIRHFSVCRTDAPLRGEYRMKACLKREVPATPKTK